MLRIPGEGDEPAPLMAPLQKVGFADEGQDPRGEKRTRSTRKKKPKEAEIPDWDSSSGKWRSSRTSGKQTARIAIGWLGAAAAVAGAIFLFVHAGEGDKPSPVSARAEMQDQFDDLVKTPLILSDEDMVDPVELPKAMERSESEFLKLARPLAERFLTAKRIEDILPIIHDPRSVGPKIRAYYPTGAIEPAGLVKFNSSGQLSYKGDFVAVSVETSGFGQKQLAFIDGEGGLTIDWESWVGWSEMPWAEVIEKKPGKPVLLRAMLRSVDYYNFGFSDEKKWKSFRLTSPDGETMIYGYVESNSLLDQRIRPSEQGATVAVTVKIHFPEDATSKNQVIIDELVSDGWVTSGAGK